MNWLGLILVIQVLQPDLLFAIDRICPPQKYLNKFGDCVDCSRCSGPTNIVKRPCGVHEDTICGSLDFLDVNLPGLSMKRGRRNKTETKTTITSTRKPIAVLKDDDDDDSYDYDYDDDVDEDRSAPNKITTDKTAGAMKAAKKKPNAVEDPEDYKNNLKDAYLALTSNRKLDFNKNGKHIKKDLSMSDGVVQSPNSSAIQYSVKSPKSNGSASPKNDDTVAKKGKAKSKKTTVNVNDHPMTIGETKFVINGEEKNENQFEIHPHVENHRIYVDVETGDDTFTETKSSTAFVPRNVDNINSSKSVHDLIGEIGLLAANSTQISNPKSTARERVQDLIGEISVLLSNDTQFKGKVDSKDDEYDDEVKKKAVNALVNGIDDDENDDDSEDDDDDDEDEDEDDEDDDDDDDEDEEEDEDENEHLSALMPTQKGKYPASAIIDIGSSEPNYETERLDDDEEDYDIIDLPKRIKNVDDNYVNVEPYSVRNDWQLLMAVSALSACLLFFIVVNIFVCLNRRKWLQLKSNFEADVEDLSVRINLMQHGGCEVDETGHMKHYPTQLKDPFFESPRPQRKIVNHGFARIREKRKLCCKRRWFYCKRANLKLALLPQNHRRIISREIDSTIKSSEKLPKTSLREK